MEVDGLHTEETLGADPLDRHGGFHHLQYDTEASFASTLGVDGSNCQVGQCICNHIKILQRPAQGSFNCKLPRYRLGAIAINIRPAGAIISTTGMQSARSKGHRATYSCSVQWRLLECWVDKEQHLGGDLYYYCKAPVILQLLPGHHVLVPKLNLDTGLSATFPARLKSCWKLSSVRSRYSWTKTTYRYRRWPRENGRHLPLDKCPEQRSWLG